MFDQTHDTLLRAENVARSGSVNGVLKQLRALGFGDFARFMWSLPDPRFSGLSTMLPAMATDEAQRNRSGNFGPVLRDQTVDFCRIMALYFQRITGRSLDHQRILDFGFGYGRMARMMYWFTDPDSYCGVDPMQESLDICSNDRMLGQFKKINYVEPDFDVEGGRFDLIFAYSVFTHTPEKITHLALRALRRHVRNNGLLVITIRPVEYWRDDHGASPEQREASVLAHRTTGYAFRDHGYEVGGEQIYGETSMSLEWLAQNHPEWEIVAHDRGIDPNQTIVFLTPQ